MINVLDMNIQEIESLAPRKFVFKLVDNNNHTIVWKFESDPLKKEDITQAEIASNHGIARAIIGNDHTPEMEIPSEEEFDQFLNISNDQNVVSNEETAGLLEILLEENERGMEQFPFVPVKLEFRPGPQSLADIASAKTVLTDPGWAAMGRMAIYDVVMRNKDRIGGYTAVLATMINPENIDILDNEPIALDNYDPSNPTLKSPDATWDEYYHESYDLGDGLYIDNISNRASRRVFAKRLMKALAVGGHHKKWFNSTRYEEIKQLLVDGMEEAVTRVLNFEDDGSNTNAMNNFLSRRQQIQPN